MIVEKAIESGVLQTGLRMLCREHHAETGCRGKHQEADGFCVACDNQKFGRVIVCKSEESRRAPW